MQLLLSLLTSTMPKDKLLKMLVLFQVLRFSESLMSPQPLLLHTVLIKNKEKRILLYLIWVVVLLMYLFLLLIMVFSKLLQLLVTLILVVKTSIKDSQNILLKYSKRTTMLISRVISVLSRSSNLKQKRQSVIYHLYSKLKSRLMV